MVDRGWLIVDGSLIVDRGSPIVVLPNPIPKPIPHRIPCLLCFPWSLHVNQKLSRSARYRTPVINDGAVARVDHGKHRRHRTRFGKETGSTINDQPSTITAESKSRSIASGSPFSLRNPEANDIGFPGGSGSRVRGIAHGPRVGIRRSLRRRIRARC